MFGGKLISAIIEIADTLRVYNLLELMRLLQISNWYMQPISFLRLLSNRSPEK